jgi:hypothetical protein
MNDISLPVGEMIKPYVRAINSIGFGLFSTEVRGDPIPEAYTLPTKAFNPPNRHQSTN